SGAPFCSWNAQEPGAVRGRSPCFSQSFFTSVSQRCAKVIGSSTTCGCLRRRFTLSPGPPTLERNTASSPVSAWFSGGAPSYILSFRTSFQSTLRTASCRQAIDRSRNAAIAHWIPRAARRTRSAHHHRHKSPRCRVTGDFGLYRARAILSRYSEDSEHHSDR